MLVLLPYVKSGAEQKVETNSALMLAEAEALVRTLEWKVLLNYHLPHQLAVLFSCFQRQPLSCTNDP